MVCFDVWLMGDDDRLVKCSQLQEKNSISTVLKKGPKISDKSTKIVLDEEQNAKLASL